MQSFEQAAAYVGTLTQQDIYSAIIDARLIHDKQKDIPAIPLRGTLPDIWAKIVDYNNAGYGAFVALNDLDGKGRELANVVSIRAHVVDMDDLSAQQSYERASTWSPKPTFAVQSSPGKFHTYWTLTQRYVGNDRSTLLQRKLRQLFMGDKSVIDPTRVLRLPGTYHHKAEPFLVNCWGLSGQPCLIEVLEAALAGVNVIDGGAGVRSELGNPDLAAPSLDWIKYALQLVDPNNLDRAEWMAITYSVKQSGWSLTDETTLYGIWSEWCAQYTANDPGENDKQWRSVRSTELGWKSLENRIPALKAMRHLGGQNPVQPSQPGEPAPIPPMAPPPLDCSGEMLTDAEQRVWFKECVYVLNLGEILTGNSRFLNTSQFNAQYGGKKFIIDNLGKVTNEPWAAATRSTLWTIPKVDHIRFLPFEPYGKIILDDLGREGINTYRPIKPRRVQGDVTPFLWHIAQLLPDKGDQSILLSYLAHNVQFPGDKIPWAPSIQSAEGAGKGVIKLVMKNAMGKPYIYFPKATELGASGAKFNAWLRNKLFIIVDEINVDEKRELIEVLKPLLSEEETEVQAKGVDQDLEDNFSNWLFFTNFKTAIPINRNGRRYAVMFSPIQTVEDLELRQMGDDYFNRLYAWLKGDGAAIVTDYLMTYPVARGSLPMRAPTTSSTIEAIKVTRTPLERVIAEAIEDALPGFRGGWIGTQSVMRRIKESGLRQIQQQVVETVIASMGYVVVGRADKGYMQENPGASTPTRSYLFNLSNNVNVADYGRYQGWE